MGQKGLSKFKSFFKAPKKVIKFLKWTGSTMTKVILGFIVGVWLGFYYVPTFLASQEVESHVNISSDIIYTRIEQVSELIATKYYYTDAVVFKDSNKLHGWKLPWTQKSFIMSYDGIVNAGIDLKAIDIKIEDKIIKIKLPEATIIAHEINDTRILDEVDGLFNNVTINDHTEILKEQKSNMEKRAIESGLLIQTQHDTKQIIEKLVLPIELYEAGYRIEFVE